MPGMMEKGPELLAKTRPTNGGAKSPAGGSANGLPSSEPESGGSSDDEHGDVGMRVGAEYQARIPEFDPGLAAPFLRTGSQRSRDGQQLRDWARVPRTEASWLEPAARTPRASRILPGLARRPRSYRILPGLPAFLPRPQPSCHLLRAGAGGKQRRSQFPGRPAVPCLGSRGASRCAPLRSRGAGAWSGRPPRRGPVPRAPRSDCAPVRLPAMRVKVLSAGRAGLPAPDGLERGTGLPELQRSGARGILASTK